MKPVPSFTGENYEWHWNYADFKDKIILDLGADVGSIAYWFLEKGARRVICVEGDPVKGQQLITNKDGDARLTIYRDFWIDALGQLQFLFSKDVDLVKIDIEGAEKHLLDVTPSVVKRVKEYLIETHTPTVKVQIEAFLSGLGYEVRLVLNLPVPGQQVLYAVRTDHV